MQAVGTRPSPITCIPNNMEKYISFSLGNIRFIDSLQFMPSSLDNLVSNLAKEEEPHFRNLKCHFTNEKNYLLLRKGVYPYSYVDNEHKLSEKLLPPKDAFFNDLTQDDISDKDYHHACQIWTKFQLKTLGDYHDLYIKTSKMMEFTIIDYVTVL